MILFLAVGLFRDLFGKVCVCVCHSKLRKGRTLQLVLIQVSSAGGPCSASF